jgi:hypothetical protein
MAEHQAFIRALPCLACGKPGPSECACVRFHPGFGLPVSDPYLLPLCGPATVWDDCCHSRKHFLGAGRFWSGLGIDPLDLAARMWRVSGDVEAGERVVRNARLVIAATPRNRAEASGQVRPPGRTERAGSQKSWQSRPRAAAQAHTDSEVDSLLEPV